VSTHYTDLAIQYCEDVLSNKITACKQIHQACKRHLDDLAAIDGVPGYPYTYSIEKAEKVCQFVSRLPHVSGRWAILKNNRFTLQPWQAFFLVSLFGWLHKDSGFRRFREALLSVPRKNGKSFLASAICLYMLLCDSEPGSQIFCCSNTMEQSLTVFRPCKLMVEQLPNLRNAFEIEANAKSLVIPDGSRCVPQVGVAHDGQSAHLAVLDEYHEAKDDTLYLSLSQSMGARTQPIMLITTTAGTTIEGPCHTFQKECEQMLDGSIDRPELFAMVYTIDATTDWTTDLALQMANPNLGVSVSLEGLKTEHRNAIRSAAKQNSFKTKKLNLWVNSASGWMNMQRWTECEDRNLKPEFFEGKPCVMSADFSTKLDMTCVLKLFTVGDTVYCFPRFYLPSDVALDPTKTMYSKWVQEGYLTVCEGSQIDMEQVLEDTVADIERYKPTEFAFDAWRAEMFTEFLSKQCPSVTLAQIPMQPRHLSPAMFEVEALVVSKHLRHPANPVLSWSIANVMVKPDLKGNIFPRKSGNKTENKIDGALCLIMCVSRAHANTAATFQPFFA
jgi:phage terminase large subunit-like protein